MTYHDARQINRQTGIRRYLYRQGKSLRSPCWVRISVRPSEINRQWIFRWWRSPINHQRNHRRWKSPPLDIIIGLVLPVPQNFLHVGAEETECVLSQNSGELKNSDIEALWCCCPFHPLPCRLGRRTSILHWLGTEWQCWKWQRTSTNLHNLHNSSQVQKLNNFLKLHYARDK